MKSCGYVTTKLSISKEECIKKYLMNYRIINNEVTAEILQESKKEDNIGRYVPYAVTAIELDPKNDDIVLANGIVFNTLPIDQFPQKFHVNSSFSLKKSRKSINLAGYLEEKQSFKNLWNLFLFRDVITDSLLELLKFLIKISNGREIKNYHEIFPTDDNLGNHFMKKIENEKIFYSKTGKYIQKKIF